MDPAHARWMSAASVAAIAGAVAAAPPAFAGDSPPRWDVAQICAASNLGSNCPRIESQNRRTVLLRWSVLPLEDRRACMADMAGLGAPSYKWLLTCLDDRQFQKLDADHSTTAPPATHPGSG